jgi:hypothetical protein
MGKLDIDYQKLYEAFFRFQTKPELTRYGEEEGLLGPYQERLLTHRSVRQVAGASDWSRILCPHSRSHRKAEATRKSAAKDGKAGH